MGLVSAKSPCMLSNFNPPIPCGMGPSWRESEGEPSDFNPPIPCGMGPGEVFSIADVRNISIHPSRVGWDVKFAIGILILMLFQSTHPVWDGTRHKNFPAFSKRNFNPPIPCGMGPGCCGTSLTSTTFQSTHPVWDGTELALWDYDALAISIHPSRVGWDGTRFCLSLTSRYFNPPIPCGMGPAHGFFTDVSARFQSTHPVWDGTVIGSTACPVAVNFNPPIPCGMGRIRWRVAHIG